MGATSRSPRGARLLPGTCLKSQSPGPPRGCAPVERGRRGRGHPPGRGPVSVNLTEVVSRVRQELEYGYYTTNTSTPAFDTVLVLHFQYYSTGATNNTTVLVLQILQYNTLIRY